MIVNVLVLFLFFSCIPRINVIYCNILKVGMVFLVYCACIYSVFGYSSFVSIVFCSIPLITLCSDYRVCARLLHSHSTINKQFSPLSMIIIFSIFPPPNVNARSPILIQCCVQFLCSHYVQFDQRFVSMYFPHM